MAFGFSVGDFLAAGSLIKDIVLCLKDCGGSASEYQELMDELYALGLVLNKIEHLKGDTEAINSIKVAALSCKFLLQDFRRKLEPYDKSLEHGKTRGWAKDSTRKVKWELTMKTDVQNLRAYLQSHTSSLNMRLSIEGVATASAAADQAARNQEIIEQGFDTTQLAMSNIQSGMTSVEQHHRDEKRQKILEWLSVSNMHDKQQDTFSRRQENTGEWLLESDEFVDWMENDDSHPTLWCPGNPGTGKTVMTSIVIDYIQKKYPGEDIGIAFVYCNYKVEQTASDLVAALARQLAEKKAILPQDLVNEYGKRGLVSKHLDLLQSLLLSLCSSFNHTFVLIDALDECIITEERTSFLSTIKALQDASVKTFITSRPNLEDIKTQLDQVPQLEIVATESDIITYLRERIKTNLIFLKRIARNPVLEKEIISTIASRASGMFLMAVLQLDRIWVERTPTKVLKTLHSLPSKLEDTYKETILRIQKQPEPDNVLGMRVLQWISKSKRQLVVDELRHALAVEWDDDEDPPRNFDDDNLLDPESMVDVCCGLVIIEHESKVIRLVHFTTQEFFLKSAESLFPDADTQISKTCLTYLSFDAVRERPCASDIDFADRLQRFPFLQYAAEHWGDHLRGKPEDDLEELALNFLNTYANAWYSTQLMEVSDYKLRGYSERYPTHTTGLHLASGFGIYVLVAKLLHNGAKVDSKDGRGQTSLSVAAERGHETVVKLLLEYDAKVDSKDGRGQTSLAKAAKHGHEAVVRLLLECQAKVELKDDRDSDPLFFAALGGHEAIVKLLLEHNAEVDSMGWYDLTALSGAAMHGHKDVIRLLLKHGAKVDLQSAVNKRTALCRAAWGGDEDVVRLLLEHGAKVDLEDIDSRTPLFSATERGHEDVVRLLLEHGAEVDLEDKDSRTPLFCAVKQGYEAVARLLLEHCAEVDSKDNDNRTPLSYAAEDGYEAAVRLLLKHSAKVDSKDKDSRTPLSYAVGSWHKNAAIVSPLLEHGAKVDLEDIDSLTPLLFATEQEHEDFVRLLLEHGAKVRSKDKNTPTPLFYAAEGGHKAVVRLLLEHCAEVDSKDKQNRTPLSYVAERWSQNEDIVRLLLKHGSKVDSKDNFNETPLSYANGRGNKVIVELLKSKGLDTFAVPPTE